VKKERLWYIEDNGRNVNPIFGSGYEEEAKEWTFSSGV